MKKIALLFFLAFTLFGYGQDYKILHHGINREFTNNFHPKLSADGKKMIYATDLDEPRKELRFFNSKYAGKERWSAPVMENKTLNFGKVNAFGGHFMSYDGEQLLFTSRRTGGVGGFDIWMSNKKNGEWQAPTNLGKPFNSDGQDGDPSLSPDGSSLYFCQCATMSNSSASGCKIVVSQRKGKGYSAPVELPSNINTGNSMSPLILADGRTLIFSSDKFNGKGGLDLYQTKMENGKWSDPKPLSFLNTEADERYISVPAKGDLGYYSVQQEKYSVLVKTKIPEEFQQDKIMWVQGKIEMKEGYSPSVQVTDFTSGKTSKWPNSISGKYSLFLPQGDEYDVSIRDKSGKYWFNSYYYDLSDLSKNTREKQATTAELIKTGDVKSFDNQLFDSKYSLTSEGKEVINKLLHILQKNSAWKINITAVFDTYKEGPDKSTADMSFSIADTIVKVNLTTDSISNDSTNAIRLVEVRDTVQSINITYHNDHSSKLKDSVESYLKSKKIPTNRFNVAVKVEKGENRKRPGFIKVSFE